MKSFDLSAVSSVAPMVDLRAGVVAMLVAALVAHAILVPKLGVRPASIFLGMSLPGLFAVAATLALSPARLHVASLAYVVAFVVLAGVVSSSAPNRFQLRRRAMAGAASMLLGVAFAWWLAFAPR